jgi:hypothetical protein
MSELADLKKLRDVVQRQLELQAQITKTLKREIEARDDALQTARRTQRRETLAEEHAANLELQQRMDDVLSTHWGVRCPEARANESPFQFGRRLGRLAKKYINPSHELHQVQFNSLPDPAVAVFLMQALTALEKSARDASTVAPGEYRAISKVDATGRKTTEFIGQRPFTDDFAPPVKYLATFPTVDQVRALKSRGIM